MRAVYSVVILMSLLCAPWRCARAEKLADVLAERGSDWLIGKWENASGDGASVSFEWALDRHAIAVNFASGATNSRGMIVYRKGNDAILYTSADNQGATGTGRWTVVNGHPTLIYEHHKPNGETIRAGFMHRRIDDETMSIGIYRLVDADELAASPVAEPRFRRARP